MGLRQSAAEPRGAGSGEKPVCRDAARKQGWS